MKFVMFLLLAIAIVLPTVVEAADISGLTGTRYALVKVADANSVTPFPGDVDDTTAIAINRAPVDHGTTLIGTVGLTNSCAMQYNNGTWDPTDTRFYPYQSIENKYVLSVHHKQSGQQTPHRHFKQIVQSGDSPLPNGGPFAERWECLDGCIPCSDVGGAGDWFFKYAWHPDES